MATGYGLPLLGGERHDRAGGGGGGVGDPGAGRGGALGAAGAVAVVPVDGVIGADASPSRGRSAPPLPRCGIDDGGLHSGPFSDGRVGSVADGAGTIGLSGIVSSDRRTSRTRSCFDSSISAWRSWARSASMSTCNDMTSGRWSRIASTSLRSSSICALRRNASSSFSASVSRVLA